MSRKHPTAGTPAPSKHDVLLSNVAHALRRAGFGATRNEIALAARQGLKQTVDALINYQLVPDTLSPPDAAILGNDSMMQKFPIDPLVQWWLTQMLSTSRPLQEKMVLFWHGHFATAYYKVRSTTYMYLQNQIFRDNALGRFDDLLTAVYKDPAMLLWLDGERNIKAAANENFGREVMELFCLGTGNYTEDDVHANSRAFTGWRLDRMTGKVFFAPRLHDFGSKTLLGQTGNWSSDDAVRILCAHPACGPFLAGKLWQFFASDKTPKNVIQKMAGAYYASDHSIQAMVQIMFQAPEFYGSDARTNHVKSPTDFMVGSARQLGLTQLDVSTWPRLLLLLGQSLFNPPNVGGWPGGKAWINSGTMLARFNFGSLFTGDNPRGLGAIDPQQILMPANARTMPELSSYLAATLGISPSKSTAKSLAAYAGTLDLALELDVAGKTRGLIHLMLASPEYQIS